MAENFVLRFLGMLQMQDISLILHTVSRGAARKTAWFVKFEFSRSSKEADLSMPWVERIISFFWGAAGKYFTSATNICRFHCSRTHPQFCNRKLVLSRLERKTYVIIEQFWQIYWKLVRTVLNNTDRIIKLWGLYKHWEFRHENCIHITEIVSTKSWSKEFT